MLCLEASEGCHGHQLRPSLFTPCCHCMIYESMSRTYVAETHNIPDRYRNVTYTPERLGFAPWLNREGRSTSALLRFSKKMGRMTASAEAMPVSYTYTLVTLDEDNPSTDPQSLGLTHPRTKNLERHTQNERRRAKSEQRSNHW